MHEELKRYVEQERARLGTADRVQRVEREAPRPNSDSSDWRMNVSQAAEFMTLFDLDLRIRFANREHAGIEGKVVGTSVLQWIPADAHPRFLKTAASAHASGLPQYYETWGMGPNGQNVGYRSWVVPLPDTETAADFAAISVDISHVGRVEQELAAQTSMLDSLARHAPDNIMVLDREHRILFTNYLAPGFTSDQVLGQKASSFLPEAYRELARTQVDIVVHTGETAAYEVPLELPIGTRWYNTRAGPIMRDGKVERVLLISTDVTTARQQVAKAAEERTALDVLERVDRRILAARELGPMIDGVLEELRSSLSAAHVCLSFPCSPDAASFSVTHEQYAPSRSGLVGLSLPMTPAYREHLEAVLGGAGAVAWSPGADAQQEPLVQHGLSSGWSMALRPHAGPAWLLGLYRNESRPPARTERALFESLGSRLADGLKSLLAQRDLRQSEERFRTLVEHAPEAIIILDVDLGLFVEVNANAEKLFGMSRAELMRVRPLELAPELQPDGRRSENVITDVLRETLRGGTPIFEWQHINPQQRPVMCEVRLLRLPHPERRWVRGSITDISARKRAEEEHRAMAGQLAQAQKMQALGQLTGGIAHDFNNLLTVIIGSLALIEMEGLAPSVVREMAQHAEAAAQRAAALTQRLLAFSRRQPLRPQSIDPRALLSGMEVLLRRTLPESIEISVAIEKHTWLCEADPVQLESAVLNLSINARDAMPRGGSLRISARNASVEPPSSLEPEGLAAGEYVLISVADTGTGMAPDVLAQAFEPFFTTKGVGQGSGLGLSMVYGFAKQSGGHVKILSEMGKGTDVQLHLPRSARSASSPGLLPVTAPSSGAGQLLLVVEDDPGVRQLVCEMLRRLGYQTLAAEDGRSALNLLSQRHDVDLMLTDMALPGGMSGAELVGHVRAERPRLPVLFMTGYSNDAVANEHPALQDVQLLPKPFSRSALAAAVREALRSSS
jgi:PAS domain S-box-containing protein